MTVPEYDWTSGHCQMSDYWLGSVTYLMAASFTLEIFSQLSTGHYFNQATLCCYVLVTFTLYVLRLMFASLMSREDAGIWVKQIRIRYDIARIIITITQLSMVIGITENTQWKWYQRSLFLAVIFAIVCIAAFSLIDGMSGGYAIAFISFFLAVSGVAVAALFFRRAQVMDSILNSTRLLAHWTYSKDDAEQSAKREYTDYQERNRAMFFIIGGMLVLVALVMMIFVGEGGFITGLFLLAFTVFLFIVSRIAPEIALKNALRSPREAYIAENGIVYEGAVYPFQSFLMRMDGVAFNNRSGKKPAVLIFSFTQLVGLNIVSPFDIEIPVPEGEEEKACKIEKELATYHRHDM